VSACASRFWFRPRGLYKKLWVVSRVFLRNQGFCRASRQVRVRQRARRREPKFDCFSMKSRKPRAVSHKRNAIISEVPWQEAGCTEPTAAGLKMGHFAIQECCQKGPAPAVRAAETSELRRKGKQVSSRKTSRLRNKLQRRRHATRRVHRCQRRRPRR